MLQDGSRKPRSPTNTDCTSYTMDRTVKCVLASPETTPHFKAHSRVISINQFLAQFGNCPFFQPFLCFCFKMNTGKGWEKQLFRPGVVCCSMLFHSSSLATPPAIPVAQINQINSVKVLEESKLVISHTLGSAVSLDKFAHFIHSSPCRLCSVCVKLMLHLLTEASKRESG